MYPLGQGHRSTGLRDPEIDVQPDKVQEWAAGRPRASSDLVGLTILGPGEDCA